MKKIIKYKKLVTTGSWVYCLNVENNLNISEYQPQIGSLFLS